MPQTLEMFPETKPPRQKPRVLMFVIDAMSEGRAIVRFRCRKCDHETGWLKMDTVTEAKRGIPCPVCNIDAIPAVPAQERVGI